MPLGFFVLVAASIAATARQAEAGTPPLFMLCGSAAGLAAWTKNEGILVLAVSALFVALTSGDARRRWTAFVLGAAVPVLAVLFFKLRSQLRRTTCSTLSATVSAFGG